ncbi:hypothetical protein RHGRI_014377 [Rhododendron griersonianum]|uniref:Pentatricopeptide repeat-containing protein n=1 Tax=Rhododendron griersonianum TaxID=479676 RepID=A0AAV6K922_9ERIC|nr:hypothetical protein RHGRI_014377 [Rhododendron griersonianum]
MQEAKLLHSRIIVSGLHQHDIYLRQIITALTTNPNPFSLLHARHLFDKIPQPSTYIYNTMFRAYASSPHPHQALALYHHMHLHGPLPDNYTFPFLLKACSSLGDLRTGEIVHGQAFKHGFGHDIFVQNSLINLYGSSCGVKMARRVFDEMGFRDVATWTSLVTCYANGRSIESARHVFDRMPKRSVVSYSAMITGYVRRNWFKDGVLLFRDMLVAKMEPNDSTIMSVLCACANLGDLNLGKWVHSYISERKKNQFDGRISTALIDMYFKCGSIKKALKVFEGAKEKHVGEWTAMLSGLAMHGLGTELIEAFEEMISSGVKPNGVTFVALFSGCTHSGLVNEGMRYFDRMTIDFGIEPTVVHFGCVVDLLGRAGFIEQAVSFIRDMPVEANAAIWGAILTSCRVYKNVEVGELAARWLISAEPWNGALYMVLLGLYRDAGRWDDVEKVKEEMKKVGCRKSPGCSSIEVNGICREFVVGDKSHPLTFEACLTLANVIAEFEDRRFFPNLI